MIRPIDWFKKRAIKAYGNNLRKSRDGISDIDESTNSTSSQVSPDCGTWISDIFVDRRDRKGLTLVPSLEYS